MLRVVSPSIIRSTHNCIYGIWYSLNRYCYLLLLWKSWNWFESGVGIVLICFGAVTDICNVASHWKYIKRNIITMHGPLNVKFMGTDLHYEQTFK